MEVKTSELIGAALDWVVLTLVQEEGCGWYLDSKGCLMEEHGDVSARFNPSTNWCCGGPIIEDNEIEVTCWRQGEWCAAVYSEDDDGQWTEKGFGMERPLAGIEAGPTPLIAAMRCLVAAELGNEVEIPEELL